MNAHLKDNIVIRNKYTAKFLSNIDKYNNNNNTILTILSNIVIQSNMWLQTKNVQRCKLISQIVEVVQY